MLYVGRSIVPVITRVESLAQASLPPLALEHFSTNWSTVGSASSFTGDAAGPGAGVGAVAWGTVCEKAGTLPASNTVTTSRGTTSIDKGTATTFRIVFMDALLARYYAQPPK